MKKIAIILVVCVLIGVAASSCATKKCPAYTKNNTVNIEKGV